MDSMKGLDKIERYNVLVTGEFHATKCGKIIDLSNWLIFLGGNLERKIKVTRN